jgi:hypothetical protein
MIFLDDEMVRLTASELNELRQTNAKNGFSVNRVTSRDDLWAAILGGLNPELQNDLMEFFETGSSPFTQELSAD